MSLVISKTKMNNGYQIGKNNISSDSTSPSISIRSFAKEIRYLTYDYATSIGAGTDVQITLSLGATAMPSIPLMFGNVTEQSTNSVARSYQLIVSFFTVTTTSFILILRNNGPIFTGSGLTFRVSIMAISL